jgi:DNA-binding XRE family transcriptional regulator
MNETLRFVITELEKRKGDWPTLAQEAGVSKRTFEKIVAGNTRNPRIDTVEKLASYFKQQAAA